MKREEYKDVINFDQLKVTMAKRGISRKCLAESVGINDFVIGNYTSKRTYPNTGVLAKICAVLQCSVNEVVEFTGYDIKEKYKSHWDKYIEPRWNGLSYEPLRRLFRSTYADDWKQKLADFYDIVPRPDLSDKQKYAVDKMNKARDAQIQEVIAAGKYKGSSDGYKSYGKGLTREYRRSIADDEPIPLPRLYDICKALHCTPDWVMTYN